MFIWFLYYGKAHLGMTDNEIWITPFGLFLDLITCHRIYIGAAKPAKEKREYCIDEVLAYGII